MSTTLKQEFGPLIPKTKMQEPGKQNTPKIGNVMTKVPVHKVPAFGQSMKPK